MSSGITSRILCGKVRGGISVRRRYRQSSAWVEFRERWMRLAGRKEWIARTRRYSWSEAELGLRGAALESLSRGWERVLMGLLVQLEKSCSPMCFFCQMECRRWDSRTLGSFPLWASCGNVVIDGKDWWSAGYVGMRVCCALGPGLRGGHMANGWEGLWNMQRGSRLRLR